LRRQKIKNKEMKKAIIILLLILTGCAQKYEEQKEFRYTIFVGKVNLSYGYGTNAFKDSLNYIVFYTKDSVKVSYKKSLVVKIEEKKRKPKS